MARDSVQAGNSVLGAGSAPRTLFAALHGQLFTDARKSEGDEDPYSLFYKRSLAMGWLDDRQIRVARGGREEEEVGAPGLWSMNDAGYGTTRPGSAERSPAVWFQVGVEPLPLERPIPAQPFARCIEDVVRWLGGINLEALQLLLPIQLLNVGKRHELGLAPSLQTMDWVVGRGNSWPSAHVPITIEILPASQLPPMIASGLAEDFDGYASGVFRPSSVQIAPSEPIMRPALPDFFWGGPVGGGFRIEGHIREWDFETLGWLASFLCDSCVRRGLVGPVFVTLSRS